MIGFDVKVWDPTAPVLRQVNDNGTPANLNDDSLVVPNAAVLPGDVGYTLALQHYIYELTQSNPNPNYLPISSGAYVDLNYTGGLAPALSTFSGPGNFMMGNSSVYDTWSMHYEYFAAGASGVNGVDDNNNGVVDEPGEFQFPPPYWAKLRGIQIKIRVFEPDSRQIREVTIVHDFLGK